MIKTNSGVVGHQPTRVTLKCATEILRIGVLAGGFWWALRAISFASSAFAIVSVVSVFGLFVAALYGLPFLTKVSRGSIEARLGESSRVADEVESV